MTLGRDILKIKLNSLCNLEAQGPVEKIVQNGVGTSVASLVPIFSKSEQWLAPLFLLFHTNNFVVCVERHRLRRLEGKPPYEARDVGRAAFSPPLIMTDKNLAKGR